MTFSIYNLIGLNFNLITIVGFIILFFIIIYGFVRITNGFVNPFNKIDKIMLWVTGIDILMVFGYSFMENLLYTTIGKVLFFSSLAILLAYFVLFYNVKGNKKVGGKIK